MNGRDWRFFGRLHTKLYNRLGGRFVDSVGWGRKVLPPTATGAARSCALRRPRQVHAEWVAAIFVAEGVWFRGVGGVESVPYRGSMSRVAWVGGRPWAIRAARWAVTLRRSFRSGDFNMRR
jgi:hypothetical protein